MKIQGVALDWMRPFCTALLHDYNYCTLYYVVLAPLANNYQRTDGKDFVTSFLADHYQLYSFFSPARGNWSESGSSTTAYTAVYFFSPAEVEERCEYSSSAINTVHGDGVSCYNNLVLKGSGVFRPSCVSFEGYGYY